MLFFLFTIGNEIENYNKNISIDALGAQNFR